MGAAVTPPSPPQEGDVIPAFKAAMRRFAVSVSIVTVSEGQSPSGMTATAVSSVSIDPPSVLVCVNRAARLHAQMQRGSAFCLNILSNEQASLSSAFGGRLSAQERFSLGEWLLSPGHPPALSDAQANVFCTVDALFEYGTHTIFIGRVAEVRLNGRCRPLIYAEGRYHRIVPVPESIETTPPDMDLTWL